MEESKDYTGDAVEEDAAEEDHGEEPWEELNLERDSEVSCEIYSWGCLFKCNGFILESSYRLEAGSRVWLHR